MEFPMATKSGIVDQVVDLPALRVDLGWPLYSSGQASEALAECRRSLELEEADEARTMDVEGVFVRWDSLYERAVFEGVLLDELATGLDRVTQDGAQRRSGHFVRADLSGIPLATHRFSLVVSFQVIEHLEDPRPYVASMARMTSGDSTALTSSTA